MLLLVLAIWLQQWNQWDLAFYAFIGFSNLVVVVEQVEQLSMLLQVLVTWFSSVSTSTSTSGNLLSPQFDPVIVLGGNLSLHNLCELFDKTKTDPSIPYGRAFSEHIKYIASSGIRNVSGFLSYSVGAVADLLKFMSFCFTCAGINSLCRFFFSRLGEVLIYHFDSYNPHLSFLQSLKTFSKSDCFGFFCLISNKNVLIIFQDMKIKRDWHNELHEKL